MRTRKRLAIHVLLGLTLAAGNLLVRFPARAQVPSLPEPTFRTFHVNDFLPDFSAPTAEPPAVADDGALAVQTVGTDDQTTPTASHVAYPDGLSAPAPANYGLAFNIASRPDFFLFGEQITPQSYPATLTSVLYPSLNSAIKDNAGRFLPSAAGARLRVTVFTADTDADLSRSRIENVKQKDVTITKDFSDPALIRSYNDYNEFDVDDVTISKGSFFIMLQLVGIGSSGLRADGTDFMFLADIKSPSKAVVSSDSGRSLTGVGVQVGGNPVDFLVLGRVTLANTSKAPPDIESVRFAKDKLTMFGTGLSLTGQLKVNGRTVVPPLTARLKSSSGRFRVQGKQGQLNLQKGDNEIVFVEGKYSSPSFRYKF